MELRHLRYFVAAPETENVSRAALKLHVSQPALSRQLRDLEEELGFSLFQRSAKSVRLTEAGRTFLIEARAVLQRADDAVKTARAIASGGKAELHVGYAPSPTVRILPQILRAFQTKTPNVRVKLHDLSTEEMLAGVREGKLQLALTVRPNRAMLRGLHFEELARETMCLAVPQNHPFARLRSVALSQVALEPLVVLSRTEYPDYHELLEEMFAATKTRLRIVEEHDSANSLAAAVESGTGLAVMPESLACSTGPRLKLVPLSPAPPPLIIGAVSSQKNLSPTAERFLKTAKQLQVSS